MNHTPGPWHVGGIDGRDKIIYAADGLPVGNAVTYHGKTAPGEMLANAQLMAAAPELLAALDRAKDYLSGPWTAPEDVCDQVKAAILKATAR